MIAFAGALLLLLACGAPAQAYWTASGSPLGSTYTWLDATTNAPSNVISAQAYNGMVDAQIAAGQEMFSATVPADISAQSTTYGLGAWDGLTTADAAVRTEAMDFLGAEGAWAGASAAVPTFAIGAIGAATFYVGWQIGTAIDHLLGISNTIASDFSGGITVNPASVTYYPAGVDLATVASFCNAGTCNLQHYKLKVGSFVVNWTIGGNSVHEIIGDSLDNGTCDYMVASRPGGGNWVTTAISDVNAGSGCERSLPTPCSPCLPGSVGTFYSKVYVIPAQTQAVPGPGQSSVADRQDVTTSYTGPNEAGKRSGADGALRDPTFDGWQRWFCQHFPDLCGGPLPLPTGVTTITIPAITPNETYGQYAAALQRAGLLGRITDSVLTDAAADPSVAPSAVVSTSPSPGTQVVPQTDVTVFTNPTSTPTTPPGGGSPIAPTLPGVSVPGAATPCSVFPFGIPCWVNAQLGALTTTAHAPSFSVGMPAAICGRGCSLDVNLDHPFGADLGAIMAIVRPILLALSFVGLVVWLGGMALGGSTGGGGSAETED